MVRQTSVPEEQLVASQQTMTAPQQMTGQSVVSQQQIVSQQPMTNMQQPVMPTRQTGMMQNPYAQQTSQVSSLINWN